MNPEKKTIAILNSPRQGGPLRWSQDLSSAIENSGAYRAKLITSIPRMIAYHLAPPGDIVHAAIPLFAHLWHRPYVLTVKGDYTIERGFWERCYRMALKRADAVTVPSAYLKERIPELADAHIIPNAVDLAKFPVVALKDRKELTLLLVSNFWFPEKARGVTRLLQLIADVMNPSSQQHKVIVVGAGAHIGRVQEESKNLPLEIRFVGWDDPKKYYPNADLFLYYSYHDNMPNAVLEAMAAGLPVLTNDVGAVREMIVSNQDGLVSSSDDEYRTMLRNLINNFSLRQRLGGSGRKTVERTFDWRKVVQNYLRLYQSLIQ